jgi:hypothetical protein
MMFCGSTVALMRPAVVLAGDLAEDAGTYEDDESRGRELAAFAWTRAAIR